MHRKFLNARSPLRLLEKGLAESGSCCTRA